MKTALTMCGFGIGLGLAALGGATAFAASGAPRGDAVHGKVVFGRCAGCHAIGASGGGGIGPKLTTIYGHPAAAVPGYGYSTALRGAHLTWNAATLDRFLAAPMKAVPGTKMGFAGLADPQDRADVIAYLKRGGKQ